MPMNFEAAPVLPTQEWTVRVAVDPKYASLQHIGNVEFSRVFDEARAAFRTHLVSLCGRTGFGGQVIAHISIDFVAEVVWTEELEVGVKVSRIGRSSYELELTVRSDDDAVMVRCRTVNVWLASGRPVPLTDSARAVLASFA